MNKEESGKAIAEVAERLVLYLEQQVEARIEAAEEQRGRTLHPPSRAGRRA